MHPKYALASTHERLQKILETRTRLEGKQTDVREAARKEALPILAAQVRYIDELLTYPTESDKAALKTAREEVHGALIRLENRMQLWQAWRDIAAAQQLIGHVISEPIRAKRNPTPLHHIKRHLNNFAARFSRNTPII